MLNKKFISLLTTTALISSMLFIGNTTVVDAAIDTSSTPQPLTYKTSAITTEGITAVVEINSEDVAGEGSWTVQPIDLSGNNIEITSANLVNPGLGVSRSISSDLKKIDIFVADLSVTSGAVLQIRFDNNEIIKLLDGGQTSLGLEITDNSDGEKETVTAFLLENDYTGNINVQPVVRGDTLNYTINYNNLPININQLYVKIEDIDTGDIISDNYYNISDISGSMPLTLNTSGLSDSVENLGIKVEGYNSSDTIKIDIANGVAQITESGPPEPLLTPLIEKTGFIEVERNGSTKLDTINISNLDVNAARVDLISSTMSFSSNQIKITGTNSITLSDIIATVSTKENTSHSVTVNVVDQSNQVLATKDISIDVKQPSNYTIGVDQGSPKTLERGLDTIRSGVVLTNLPPFPLNIKLETSNGFILAQDSWNKPEDDTTFTIPATQIQIPEDTQSANVLFTVKVLHGTSMIGSSNFTDLVKERTIDEPRVSSNIPTIPVGIKTKSGKITISNLPSNLPTTVTLSTDDSKVTLGTASFTKSTGTTSMDIETDITVDKKFKESRFDLELDIKVGNNTFKKTITVRVSELDKGKVELRSTPIVLKDKPVEVTFKVTLPDAEDYDTEDHTLTVKGAKIDSIVRSDKYLDVEKDSDKIVFTSDEYDGKTYEFTTKLTPSADEITITMKSDDLFDEVDLKLSSKSGTDAIYKINGLVTEASNNGKEISVGNIFVGNNLQEGIYRIYITKPSTEGDPKTAQAWVKSPEPTFKSAFSNEVNVSIGRSPMLDEYFPNTSYIEFRVNRELKAVEIKNIKISGAKTINDYDIVLAFTEVGSDFTKVDSFPGYLKVNRKVNSIALQVGTDITLVNGEIKKSPNKPTIIDGQPYMQVSFISDALGRFLSWDGNKNSIYISSISNMDETIEINLNTGGGTKKTSVGTSQIVLKNKPKVIDGRTMISLNDIVTVMNLPQPQWDPITKSIIIKDE